MMRSRTKILALVVCAVFVLFSALTVATNVAHAGHHCLEESCAVCAMIHYSESLIKLSGALLICVLAGLLLLRASAELSVGSRAIIFVTPVTTHVRMNH